MSHGATIVELLQRTDDGIYAVPYRRRRPRKPQRVCDGLIVERPTTAQRREAPEHPAPCLELAAGGGLATIHHQNLGLVAGFILLDGIYVLPSGEVAAIYGADIAGLGEPRCVEDSSALD